MCRIHEDSISGPCSDDKRLAQQTPVPTTIRCNGNSQRAVSIFVASPSELVVKKSDTLIIDVFTGSKLPCRSSILSPKYESGVTHNPAIISIPEKHVVKTPTKSLHIAVLR